MIKTQQSSAFGACVSGIIPRGRLVLHGTQHSMEHKNGIYFDIEDSGIRRRFLRIAMEDRPAWDSNVYYKRAYESSSMSIFELLTNRSEKQLMDHVRPSIMMMQIRIAQLSAQRQI